MTTKATAGPLQSGRPGTPNLPLELIVNQTNPTTESVEERVARHLAAKDWLTTPDRWDNGSAWFRADYLTAAREVIALVQEPAVVSPPTDRAALAAVRALHQPMERGPFTICAHCSGWDGKWRCLGVVTDYPCPTVRALDGEQAAEAHSAGAQQQDDTEARTPLHAWRVETRDGEWVRGSHFLNRQAAVERYETANSTAPLWRDGTPIERRIVRETTTYTVEEPAAEAPRCDAGFVFGGRCTKPAGHDDPHATAPVAQHPAAADDEEAHRG